MMTPRMRYPSDRTAARRDLGLIWALAVLPASPTGWDGAVELFKFAENDPNSARRCFTYWIGGNYYDFYFASHGTAGETLDSIRAGGGY